MADKLSEHDAKLAMEQYNKLPKHDAKQAMEQYIKVMHDTEGIDWDKVIAEQARKKSAPDKKPESLKDKIFDTHLEITYPPTISNNIPMPVDGGYENNEGFDDLGYDCP